MEGLEDELTCPVCLELFTCPLQLPCNHNLCRRCAEVMLQSKTDHHPDDEEAAVCSGTSVHSSEDKSDSFFCPTCRLDVSLDMSGLDGLRKNILLQNIVDRYIKLKGMGETEQEISCQLCKEDPPKMAAQSCLVCKASYCEQCLSLTHPAFPPFTEHKLVSPRTTFDEAPPTVMCPDHPTKPVEMYCVQDQTPVCLLCEKVGRHKQHNMAALEEVFSQRRAELQARVDRLGARVAQGEEKIRGLEERREYVKNRATEIKAAVTKECSALCEVIQHRETEMSDQVELARKADDKILEKEVDKTKDAVHKARSSLAYGLEALKESDHASFLQAVEAVMAKVDVTVDVPATDHDDTLCEIDTLSIDLSQTMKMLQSIDIRGSPQAPVILDDQCRTTMDTAYITWQPESKALGYKVCYKTGTVQMVAYVKDNSFTARCLRPGTKYKFEVKSRNKNGISPEASIELITEAPLAAPIILDKKCSTTTEDAYIEWQHDGHLYEVLYTLDTVQMAATIYDHSFTAKHLSPGTKYTFKVKSKCDIGSSAISSIDLVTLTLFCFRLDPSRVDKDAVQFSEENRSARILSMEGQTFLGDTPIVSGRHYWEVCVDSTSYSVGVAYGNMPRGKDIRESTMSWAFDRSDSVYSVHHNDNVTYLTKYQSPSKIGILVDHGLGQLSFYNADTRTLIYTHRMAKKRFAQPVYPAFTLWVGSLKIHSPQ